jgi:hypothetical protein
MTTTDRAVLTADDLRRLAEEKGASISILLGPHRAGSGTRPAAIRLRTLLHDAERTLGENGMGEADRRALLEPLEELLNDSEFSGGHHDSFALFRNARMLSQYRLPWETADAVTVEGRFALRDLVAPLAVPRVFLLLALSKKRMRLYECSERDSEEVPLPGGVPDNFEEFAALNLTDYRLSGRSPGGNIFGFSQERDKVDRHFRDYCVAIGRGMAAMVRERSVPLVVAGTTEETVLYRAANEVDAMYAGEVETSPDGGITERELVEKARAVLGSWKSREAVNALANYERLSGTPRVARERDDIVRAAVSGRVEHLFFNPGTAHPGDYARLVGLVPLAGEFVNRNEDLLNAAVADTLRNSGHVWTPSPEHVAVVAVLRY